MNYFSIKILTTASIFFLSVINSVVSYADEDDKDSKKSHVMATEIKWELSTFGPEIWKVKGDLVTGEHITYIKFAAGTTTPLHIHSADYVGIDITGTSRHRVVDRDDTNKLITPGSHWTIKANEQHVSECLPGFECIMAIIQKEAFDFIPLGPSPFDVDED